MSGANIRGASRGHASTSRKKVVMEVDPMEKGIKPEKCLASEHGKRRRDDADAILRKETRGEKCYAPDLKSMIFESRATP